ncbi:hypothetical protein F6455_06910 [Proteobacteria bacterium 005FR1]|nr:hypothetical protein [Proteobacteria bacterium 005FR1]
MWVFRFRIVSPDPAAQLIDGKIVRSRLQEGALSSSSDVMYAARVEQTPAGRNVLSVQVKDLNGNLPGQPERGMYMMAAEFSAASAEATEIDVYYPPGDVYQNIVDATRAWSQKGSAACPELG